MELQDLTVAYVIHLQELTGQKMAAMALVEGHNGEDVLRDMQSLGLWCMIDLTEKMGTCATEV